MSSEDESDSNPFIVDFGSCMVKMGWAGDDFPRVCYPTAIASSDDPSYPKYIGDTALDFSHAETHNISRPITTSRQINWDDMEAILHHGFYNELTLAPADHPIIFTEPLYEPKENRENLIRIMFETFNVPAFYSALQATLVCYSSGAMTCMVLDSGHTQSQVAAVYDGYILEDSCVRIDISGSTVTNYLKHLVRLDLCHNAENLKESLCFISESGDCEIVDYKLPDGRIIKVKNERSKCCQPLFNFELFQYPTFDQLNCGGFSSFQDVVKKSISNCDIDVRSDLLRNVVLAGGNTMIDGFPTRLENELKKTCKTVNVKSYPERKYTVWIGASVLGSLSSFQKMSILKSEYDEIGPYIVHSKCDHFNPFQK